MAVVSKRLEHWSAMDGRHFLEIRLPIEIAQIGKFEIFQMESDSDIEFGLRDDWNGSRYTGRSCGFASLA